MTTELNWLALSAAVFFVYILGEAVAGNLQHSARDLLGPRDGLPAHGVALGRAKRATANMIEGMAMFVPLVLVAVLAGRTNDMTALGCALFVGARVAFAPLYWFGVPVLRTLVWAVSITGLVLIFLQILPFAGA
jgi:uncharacterized MAPEG superfamily protein